MKYLAEAWTFKLSLLPVLSAFLIFEIPQIIRRITRVLYTPIYFMFFPLGHSDELYAQYFNEDDFFSVGAAQTDEQKESLRKRIIAKSVLSMVISTIAAPLLCGFLIAFYLTQSQFNEFVLFLLTIKVVTIIMSLNHLRHVSFIDASNSFYLVVPIYIGYLVLIWRTVTLSYASTASNISTLGVFGALIELLDYLYVEIFLYVVIVALVTWAITYFYTDPRYIQKRETYEG